MSLSNVLGLFSVPKKTIFTFGCLDNILTNSKPTKPVEPSMATDTFFVIIKLIF